jgi:glutaconate CoA-transferase subunit A
MKAQAMPLRDAVAQHVQDGMTVALEGFTHLIPFAAGHEIIRQRRRDLTLVRMTPDLIYDQMIGMGCAKALTFSWGGNPGVGSLHRLRDAIEHAWPHALAIDEHSHAGMAVRYSAGASGLPFGVLRGYTGTDLPAANPARISQVTCPFTGEVLTALPAITPDVTVLHAQAADHEGNVLLRGIVGASRGDGGAHARGHCRAHRRLARRADERVRDPRLAGGGDRRGAGGRVSVVRAGALCARQCLLPGVG